MSSLRFLFLAALLLPAVGTCFAEDARTAILDPAAAGPDFQIQGEYSGMIGEGDQSVKVGIQVVAQGDGKFLSVGYIGGLPGDGWDGTAEKKVTGTGHMEGDVCILKADANSKGRAEIKEGVLSLYTDQNVRIGEFAKVRRESPTLGQKPPEGAVVLFDGTTADLFDGGRLSDDRLLMEGVNSKQKFGSYKLHVEFLLSYMPYARGQGRANSGCYQQARYEVQILDSFGLSGEDNECGGIYKIARPAVNMCFPPLSWQTYDIDYHAAKFDAAGQKSANAWMTVRHNGVVIHDHQELPHATTAAPLKEGPEDGPIHLQNHGNPIRFRNIWLTPTND
ncbi:MAG: DUF1080 domain-containing protein [Planctomycetaceae bacterium]